MRKLQRSTQAHDYHVQAAAGLEFNMFGKWARKMDTLRGISPATAKALAVVLVILVFALDYYTAADINPADFYACVIIVLAWTRSNRWLWGGTALVVLLAIAGLTLGSSPVGHPHINWVDWTNRFITACMLIVTAGFVRIGVHLSQQVETSERLLVEVAARERAEEALRKQNARIRRLVDSNIIGIFFWKIDGAITEANEAFLQTLGYSRDDLLSGQLQWSDLNPPGFRALDLRAMDQLRRTGNFPPYEKEYFRKDGARVPVLVGGTYFENSTEEGVAFVLDLTERVCAQDMLRRVQADFAHAARVSMLGELTASIAHELRQPLASIAANGTAGCRWLERETPNVEEAHCSFTRVEVEVQRCVDIIGRIRAMALRREPEHALVSLDELIDEALLFLRYDVEAHDITVSHVRAAGAPGVVADRIQLQQVIVNLVLNAIQATERAARAERRITIRTAQSDSATVCCTVEDSGLGIAPEHFASIFKSFFTTRENGMGMGLSICRSIVEAHGGCIVADNASVHGGARLSFTLPIANSIA
jgi:PAS domain S-box-containing protein